jgi:hypothetical protein
MIFRKQGWPLREQALRLQWSGAVLSTQGSVHPGERSKKSCQQKWRDGQRGLRIRT